MQAAVNYNRCEDCEHAGTKVCDRLHPESPKVGECLAEHAGYLSIGAERVKELVQQRLEESFDQEAYAQMLEEQRLGNEV